MLLLLVGSMVLKKASPPKISAWWPLTILSSPLSWRPATTVPSLAISASYGCCEYRPTLLPSPQLSLVKSPPDAMCCEYTPPSLPAKSVTPPLPSGTKSAACWSGWVVVPGIGLFLRFWLQLIGVLNAAHAFQ